MPGEGPMKGNKLSLSHIWLEKVIAVFIACIVYGLSSVAKGPQQLYIFL
jgi:hypothetical protein